MFLEKVETRKTIALLSAIAIIVILLYSVAYNRDLPQSSMTLVSALMGYVGYYFGKSTALDSPDKGGTVNGNTKETNAD